MKYQNTLIFCLFFSLTLTAQAQTYPDADWQATSPEAQQVDAAQLKAWADYTFTETASQKTDALLLIRHGKVVYERYGYGYHANMRHLSWSMAKSFTSILFGIAEGEGVISRDAKMNEFYAYAAANEAEQKMRDQVTLASLLTMSSGIQWKEDYGRSSPLQSDVTQMLYMNAHRDMAAYTASRAMRTEPNTQFVYSTGNTNVVMGALKHKLGQAAYNVYPWTKLFNPIGMKNVVFEQDDAGTFLGGSYVYATARDYARFGYLLLNNGRWKNTQLVPTDWMKFVKTLSPGFANGTAAPSDLETYGAGFWLNVAAPHYQIKAPYPNLPADTFLAVGHAGQTITIIPSQDLVAVRLAHDTDAGIDHVKYFDLLIQTVGKKIAKKMAASSVLEKLNAFEEPPASINQQTQFYYLTKLIASLRAKDFCSCHFVVGQTVEFCKALVKNGFPQIRMTVNESKKSVTFGLLPAKTAQMTSETFGCSFKE